MRRARGLVVAAASAALAATLAAPAGAGRVVTGLDSGGAPTVKRFSGGVEQNSFDAYASTFTGGVRVAAGDVDGDGVADIVTGAGAGAGPHVKVFDGVTLAPDQSFFAFDPSFTGGVNVAAGDVNGDGFDDIVVSVGSAAGPRVKVFSGSTLTVLADFFAYNVNFTGGVRVAAGDVNGDGFADIVTGPGPGGGPEVKVFDGRNVSTVLKDFFAYTPSFTGGVFVAAGDVNGDGLADIVTGADATGGPDVRVYSGADTSALAAFFAYEANFTGGVRVGAGRVNADNRADVVVARGAGGQPQVKVFEVAPGGAATKFQDFLASTTNFTGGVFAAAEPGARVCAAAPSGLVSWYRGEGNANDSVAGRNGALGGVTFTTAKVGSGFSFDGSNDTLTLPSPAAPSGASARTVSMWLKVDPASTGPDREIFFYGNTQTRQGFGLDVDGVTAAGNVKLELLAQGDDLSGVDSGVPAGHLMHVVATYDGATTLRLFVNGQLKGTHTLGGTLDTGATPITFGHLTGFFGGVVDEIQFFNRALSQAEAQSLYVADSAGTCSAPTAVRVTGLSARRTGLVARVRSWLRL